MLNDESLSKIREYFESYLNEDDDPVFWLASLKCLLFEFKKETDLLPKKYELFFQIGACSHWLRPHQTRWKAAGGFAWPAGYSKSNDYSRNGLPEFDWFIILYWDRIQKKALLTDKFKGKKKLVFRAALPTRTNTHKQATVHTIWVPGSPSDVDNKKTCFYGFKKMDQYWECVADSSKI